MSEALAAPADSFPSRPITMMIPHGPGSSTDVSARALQPFLAKALGVSIVVENQGGGGGNAAHLATYRAAPDGYTIELSLFPSAVMGELVRGGNFKVLDFTFLYNVTGADYNAISVKYDSPFKDLHSLIEAAKKQKITMAGSGIGTNGHMAMKLLERSAGVRFEYVSYDGGTEAAVSVAGGHTHSGVSNIVSTLQLVNEKKMRMLAVIGEKRHPAAPDTPTAIELGYKGTAMGVCMGMFGPPKMPVDIAKKLESAMEIAVKDPGLIAQFNKLGSTVQPMGGADFKKLVEAIYAQVDSVKDELRTSAK